jgi:hypothetical protein
LFLNRNILALSFGDGRPKIGQQGFQYSTGFSSPWKILSCPMPGLDFIPNKHFDRQGPPKGGPFKRAWGSMFKWRRTPELWLRDQQRLATEAIRLREQAEKMAPCALRDELLRKARQLSIASHLGDWLESPGLRPPS